MESSPNSILQNFKRAYINESEPCLRVNPGVTKQLLHWLSEQEFPREQFLANDPLISQKLLIREGIEMVLRRLEQEYNKHEQLIREQRLHAESTITEPK